jgi:tape measure domain-containing protein
MPVERLQVEFSEKGGDRVVRVFADIGRAAARTEQAVDRTNRRIGAFRSNLLLLKNALLTVFVGGIVTREVFRLADAFTLSANRIGLLTKSFEETRMRQEELLESSQRTRSSFEANVELYGRIALSTRHLNLEQGEQLKIVESLNQAVTLSGATAQEARNGIIQFAQGLGASRLAGDELRAVLEQLPFVADVIASKMNVTREALRELGSQGRITTEVMISAFQDAREELAEKFAKTIPTIGQAFVLLENSFVRVIGKLETSIPIFRTITDVLISASNNAEFLARSVLAGSLLFALIQLQNFLKAFFTFLKAQAVFLLTNPFTAAFVAVSALIAVLVSFGDQLEATLGPVANLHKQFTELMSTTLTFRGQSATTAEFLRAAWEVLIDRISKSFRAFVEYMNRSAQSGGLRKFVNFIRDWAELAVRNWVTAARVIELAWDRIANSAAIASAIRQLGKVYEGVSKITRNPVGALTAQSFLKEADRIENIIALRIALQRKVDEVNSGDQSAVRGVDLLREELAKAGATPFVSFEDAINETQSKNYIADFFKDLGKVSAENWAEGFDSILGGAIGSVFERLEVNRQSGALSKLLSGAATKEVLDGLRKPISPGALPSPSITDPSGRRTQTDILGEGALLKVRAENASLATRIGLSRDEIQLQKEKFDIVSRIADQSGRLKDTAQQELETALRHQQSLQIRLSLLDEIRGSAQDAARRLEELESLRSRLTPDEFSRKKGELRNQELSGKTDIASGAERGLNTLKLQITDFASVTENALTSAFSSAEDALVEFVKTGKLSFSSMVDGILADLTRLLARQALGALINSFSGGGGGFGSILTNLVSIGSRAAGGPVVGGRPYLVGERGPELFVPESRGMVHNQVAAAPAAAPINIVNVMDPAEITAAMSGPAGERVIVNVVRRNRRLLSKES